MAIIVSKNNRDAEKLNPKEFDAESSIQEYILENPNVIPLYEISEDTRLFVAAREFRTTSGPIDALGFDEAGNIYIVETKLYRNPDKRTVVAQALDYGASLWKNTINADEFIAQLNAHTQKAFNNNFATQYAVFFNLEDASSNIEAIIENLNAGNIKFVVMMDKLHDSLKDLILYVNQNSKFDIYAVELEYYKHAEFEIMIPKLFGNEVKKDVTPRKSSGSEWTEKTVDDFLADIHKQHDSARYSETVYRSLLTLHELYTAIANRMNDKVTYWHRSNTDDIRCLIEYGEGGVYLVLDSQGRFESWKHNKRTDKPQEKFINSIEQKATELHLFGKDWITDRMWGFLFNKFDDKQAIQFVDINQSSEAEMHWS